MAFANKTDYCGLTDVAALTTSLLVKDDAENLSVEKYQPQGQDGSFIATEVYGEDRAPTNNYALAADISVTAGAIKLNAIKSINFGTTENPDNHNFALESFNITTSAGTAPSISATCQEIESTATDAAQCHYSIPAFTLTKKHHAQILFNAFTITGANCHLIDCAAAIGGSISKDKVEGVKVSSDIASGVITITGSILQSGSAKPVIAATENSGFILTQPLTCTNPEAAYKTYTFELQKMLAKDVPTAA